MSNYSNHAKKSHIINRDKWDWSLSNCALGKIYGISPQAVRKTRIKLGENSFKKSKRQKVYSENLHCGPLSLDELDKSEGLSKIGATPIGWKIRFWRSVDKGSCKECWPWVGTKLKAGYGQLFIGTIGKTRKSYCSHRLSFVMHHGDIPRGKIVRHKCDNPSCVNPNHLELGTSFDNVMDAVNRGGLNCGERNGQSKYSKSQVMRVRELFAKGIPQKVISRITRVSCASVNGMVNNRSWVHV